MAKSGKTKVIVLIVCFIFVLIVFNTVSANKNDIPAIKSEKDAITLAKQYIGFKLLQNFSKDIHITANTALIKDDETPFINNMISNRKLYRVIIENIPVNSFRNINYDRPPVNFEILLDSETGKLLKFSAKLKDTTIAKNRKDLIKTNRGFAGLPDEKPFPFLEILKKCPHSLSEAVEIEAVYIMRKSKIDGPSIPTWIVSLYAVPAIVTPPPIYSDSGVIESRSGTIIMNYDIILDGVTGKLLTSGGKERR